MPVEDRRLLKLMAARPNLQMMVTGSNVGGSGSPAGGLGNLLREAAATWQQALAMRDDSIRQLRSQLELVRVSHCPVLPVLMSMGP